MSRATAGSIASTAKGLFALLMGEDMLVVEAWENSALIALGDASAAAEDGRPHAPGTPDDEALVPSPR